MRMPDFHIHTNYSPDSSMQQTEAIEAAIKAGITDMCFTEHMDLGHHMDSFNRKPEFDGMYESIQKLRLLYPEITVGYGVEAGYINATAKATAEILSKYPFDYVLLSTHCVDGMDCYVPESKRGRDKEIAYKRYLETVYESVSDSALKDSYDCVGHIGYIAKCKHYEDNGFPYTMFPHLFDEILLKIIKGEKGIEVNVSGLQRAGHVLPHPSIISRYYELGGRIATIGSDAHRPESVGVNIKSGMEIIKACGFKEIAVFSKRKPEFIS